MNTKKIIFLLLTLVAIGIGLWFFKKIVIYLVISMVLFLMGYPITSFIEQLKIGGKKINESLAALFTLLIIAGLVSGFFALVLPPLINQIAFLSDLNVYEVIESIVEQFPSLENLLGKLGDQTEVNVMIHEQFSDIFNIKTVSSVLNNLVYYLSGILGGVFCVLFITFYLLKDEQVVSKTFLLLTPNNYEEEVKAILRTSKKMMSQYFRGLTIDVFIVGCSTALVMWLFGIKNALIIGCIAGFFNVIPYVGPIITLSLALFLGVSGCIESNHYELIQSTMIKISFSLLVIYMIDSAMVQPYIYSNSVKAHPLEIFLVILFAGTLAGIGGMVVAIPSYTLIRIIAREFLTQFRFFKKLTEKIDEI